MQLDTKATDSVKCLYRNSAPPTIICVGVMKLYLVALLKLQLHPYTPTKPGKENL